MRGRRRTQVTRGLATFVAVAALHTHACASESFVVEPTTPDGRCLFRAVAKGAKRFNLLPPDLGAKEETEVADALRVRAVAALEERRAEYEWAIEGPFERYCAAMRRPHTWGGEPELLMLAEVLRAEIKVYMATGEGGSLREIASYGSSASSAPEACSEAEPKPRASDPIEVFFHGGGHYEGLVRAPSPQSKL